jgi:archaellum biogenesis protein FlaJ (TadC family)
MNDRIEKNRHHLAMAVSFIVSLAGAGAVLLIDPTKRFVVSATIVFFLFVLVGRTVMIEKGVRRQPIKTSKAFETKTIELLKTKFGIQITKD